MEIKTKQHLYLGVNKTLESETYVVASKSSYLSGLPEVIDEKNTMFVTIVFDADTGDFYTGRTAIWDGLNDYTLALPQFIKSAITVSSNTYNFNLQSYNNGWTNDQAINGFQRVSVGQTGTATIDTSSDYTLHYYRVKQF